MQPGLVLIVAAGVALYVACRSAVDVLRGPAILSAGRIALGLWMPVAIVAVWAMFLNRPEIAIGVIFASSVAGLSLVTGIVTFLAGPVLPPAATRIGPTVLVAALLVFLAGFRTELNDLHSSVLAAEGIVLLWVWHTPNEKHLQSQINNPQQRVLTFRIIQLILTIALAAVGAWAGVEGTVRTSQLSEIASAGLLSATLLSPLLILPMLGVAIDLAHRGQSAVAVTSQIAVALLNLCLLLPVVIMFGYFRQWMFAHSPANSPLVQTVFHTRTAPPASIELPLAVWRIDVVALIALGLFLFPVSQGKWSLSKINGLALIAGYAAYILLTTTLGVRMI